MSYPEVDIHPKYWKRVVDVYALAYEEIYNRLGFIKDDVARVKAANGFMIPFSDGMGLNEVGTIVWGLESPSEDDPTMTLDGFRSFATRKVYNPPQAMPKQQTQSSFDNAGGVQQGQPTPPQQQNVQSGPSSGYPPSDKQMKAVRGFLNSRSNPDFPNYIYARMREWGVNSVDELNSKQASEIIGYCMKALPPQQGQGQGQRY